MNDKPKRVNNMSEENSFNISAIHKYFLREMARFRRGFERRQMMYGARSNISLVGIKNESYKSKFDSNKRFSLILSAEIVSETNSKQFWVNLQCDINT